MKKIKFSEEKLVKEFKNLAVEQLNNSGLDLYLTDYIVEDVYKFRGGHIVSTKKDDALNKFYIIKKYKLDFYSDIELSLTIQTLHHNYEFCYKIL